MIHCPDPDAPWEPYPGLTIEELGQIIDELVTRTEHLRERDPASGLLGTLNRAAKKGVRILPDQVRRVFSTMADHLTRDS